MPKMMPVAKQTATRNAKTVASIVNLIQYGLPTSATAMSKRRHADERQPETEHAAEEREQRALDEELRTTRARLAPRAMRRATSRRALGRPREQQVGDVRARDEQHEPDGPHQREKHDADRAAVEAVVERHDLGVHRLVRVGILLLELLRDAGQLRLRLLEGDAGREPAEQIQSARVPALHLGIRNRAVSRGRRWWEISCPPP